MMAKDSLIVGDSGKNVFGSAITVLSSVTIQLYLSFIGLILLFTGLVHLANSYFFLSSILEYRITGPLTSKYVAVLVPTTHIAVGMLLFCRIFVHGALLITATLFTVYLMAQMSVLFRQIEIDCGCFGVDSDRIDGWSVVRISMLAIGTWVVFLVTLVKKNLIRWRFVNRV